MSNVDVAGLRGWVAGYLGDMPADLAAYVGRETPSGDKARLAEAPRWLEESLLRPLGEPERVRKVDGGGNAGPHGPGRRRADHPRRLTRRPGRIRPAAGRTSPAVTLTERNGQVSGVLRDRLSVFSFRGTKVIIYQCR